VELILDYLHDEEPGRNTLQTPNIARG
jgi:hypothetical protein